MKTSKSPITAALAASLRAACLLALLAMPLGASARTAADVEAAAVTSPAPDARKANSERDVTVYYLGVFSDFPQGIKEFVKTKREEALKSGNAVIFYVPNVDPAIAVVNLGTADDDYATDEAMNLVYKQLDAHNRTEMIATDREKFTALFTRYGIINDDHKVAFKQANVDFLVGEHFCNLRLNEKLIAPIYYVLRQDVENLHRIVFRVSATKDALEGISTDHPFGYQNLGDINKNIHIQEVKY